MSYPYISFDPGETTGVCCWNDEGEPVEVNQFKLGELDTFLWDYLYSISDQVCKTFIIEKYVIYGSKTTAHVGRPLRTAEVIGTLKSYARRNKIEVVEQMATIKNIAKMWSRTKTPPNHSKSHWHDAYLHGYYYLHNKGIIKAKVLEDD